MTVRGASVRTWMLKPACLPVVLAAVTLCAGLLLAPSYRHQINPDGVSYISIAHHLLAGHWWDH